MREDELWEALDRGADGVDEIDFAHSAWERGMGLRRRRTLLTGGGLAAGMAAAALVFALMGGGQQEALVQPGPAVSPTAGVLVTDSPEPPAEATSSTLSEAPTTQEVTVTEVAAPTVEPSTEEPTTPAEPLDQPTGASTAPTGPVAPVDPPTTVPPTTEPPAEDPAFPTDPVAYADALVQAWADGAAGRTAELTTNGVEAVLATFTSTGGWVVEPGDPVYLDGEHEGLVVLWYGHPGAAGGYLVVVLESDALGGPDAIVGVRADTEQGQGVEMRPDVPLAAYAGLFLEAWIREDEAEVRRLSSPDLQEQLATWPTLADTGTGYVPRGFSVFRERDPSIIVRMPDDQNADRWMVTLDTELASQGLDHGITGFGFNPDPLWL